MKIEKISLADFKGVTEIFTLDSANLICGPNTSGKTAIIDGLRLALLGYHPKLGKQNKSVFSLASGASMEASIITDNGDMMAYTLTEQQGSIRKEWTEREWDVGLRMQLDPDLFFDSPLAERNKNIFTLLMDDDNYEVLDSLIGDINRISVDESELSKKIVDAIADGARDIFKRSQSANDAFMELTENLREGKSKATDYMRRMEKTLDGLSELASGGGRPLIQSEEFYQNQIDRLRAEIEKESNSVAERRVYLDRIIDLQEKLRLEKEKSSGIKDEARLDSIKVELSELQSATEEQLAVLVTKKGRLEEKIDKVDDLLGDKQGHESLESIYPKLSTGVYMAKIELLVSEGEEVTNVVWEIEPFGKNELMLELSQVEQEIVDVNEAYEETIKPLHAERDKIELIDDRGSNEDKIKMFKDDIEESNEMLGKLKSGGEESLSAMREELSRLEALLRDSTSKEIDMKNLSDARDKANEAAREVEILKQAEKITKGYSERITAKVLDGLLDAMNRFSRSVTNCPYSISGNEIGYYRDGTFVGHESFSGSETSLLRCAVTVAMASRSAFKIAIIDELGRFDETRKSMLLKNVVDMVADGFIDQFIGVDVQTPPNNLSGLNVIELNG